LADQEGDTLGPEAVSGKNSGKDPEGQQGKPDKALQRPKPFDKGADQKKEEQQAADKFGDPDFLHAVPSYTDREGRF
jgi:hypothetical protein